MSCVDYCAGRLRGIAENQRLLQQIPEDFEVEVTLIRRRLKWVPKHAFVATCEHRRNFLVNPTKETRKKHSS